MDFAKRTADQAVYNTCRCSWQYAISDVRTVAPVAFHWRHPLRWLVGRRMPGHLSRLERLVAWISKGDHGRYLNAVRATVVAEWKKTTLQREGKDYWLSHWGP